MLNMCYADDTPNANRTASAQLPLPAIFVAFVESKGAGNVFRRTVIQIDFEFVHSVRVVARTGDRAENGAAHIDDKRSARFAWENTDL